MNAYAFPQSVKSRSDELEPEDRAGQVRTETMSILYGGNTIVLRFKDTFQHHCWLTTRDPETAKALSQLVVTKLGLNTCAECSDGRSRTHLPETLYK